MRLATTWLPAWTNKCRQSGHAEEERRSEPFENPRESNRWNWVERCVIASERERERERESEEGGCGVRGAYVAISASTRSTGRAR